MGGHGGLNILPQKSWNVYGRENRLKVARDEAKFEEENKQKRERHVQAEREARRAALLQRAREKQARDHVSDALPSTSQQALPAAEQAVPRRSEPADALAVQPVEPPTTGVFANSKDQSGKGGLLQHINFWHEDELKMAHPDVKAEQKMEQKRRGKADTQTSDAKFDEQFKLGHRMEAKPWYAKGAAEPIIDGASIADQGQAVALTAGTDLLLLDSAVNKKSEHKHKHKHKRRDKGDKHSKSFKAGVKSVAELRAERQAREQSERQRQKKLLQAHSRMR